MGGVGAQLVAVAGGVVGVPVGVDGDQVEGRPVDPLPDAGGVGDPAAERGAAGGGGVGEEGVEAGGRGGLGLPGPGAEEGGDPLAEVGSGQEPVGEEGGFAAEDEDHLGAGGPQPLGAAGAVRQDGPHGPLVQAAGEGREPDLQAVRGGVLGGEGDPLRVGAGDPDGRAVQVLGDAAHLGADLGRGEVRPGGLPVGVKPVS